jgi:protoporphyrinogen oxidase
MPLAGTVAILGAGPAGLAAGLALTRAGWRVDVFEQDVMVGGLARTVSRGGFRFDIGGHRWFSRKPALNQFVRELLGPELIEVDRSSAIYFDGKYVQYPLRVGNVLTQIGPGTSVRAMGDFLTEQVTRRLKPRPIVSMEDAYVAQFGRTLYELFFRRYSEKLWGDECDRLSGDWVTQRSKGLSLYQTVREAVKPSDAVDSLVERFLYPRLGYGRISERMAEEIERGGGAVHLGRRVVAVCHDGAAITSVTVSDGTCERLISSDAVISSIPMTELARITRPAADRAVLRAAESLTYRGLMTVHLLLDRPHVTSETWLYVQDPKISFARLHEPRNWSAALAPEGKTSLVLEIFCEADDTLWRQSDEEICALVINNLARDLKMIEPRDVMDGFVVRSRDAYPRYGLGYRQAVDAIKSHLASFANLTIVGRGGTFRYNNADHAIETGLLAARGLLGEAVDIERVNSAPEYLEGQPAVE